ncbi:MAG: hypothetical protein IT225_10355 [Flavobacteriales bacterium]|jgi:hypothetical protein|nr:hypothetical protein [Flavobacteriales bacterium]
MDPEAYPVYRCLVGGGHYYRIDRPDHFEELQRIGSRWLYHAVDAKAYPEQLRVREMLSLDGPYDVLDPQEWSRTLDLARALR